MIHHRLIAALAVLPAAFIALAAGALIAHAQTPPDIRVTQLGTGSPVPIVERFGPSTLIEAGSEKLVFDCGRGCPIRLVEKDCAWAR